MLIRILFFAGIGNDFKSAVFKDGIAEVEFAFLALVGGDRRKGGEDGGHEIQPRCGEGDDQQQDKKSFHVLLLSVG